VKNLAKFLLLSILAWPAFAQTPCSPLPDVGACSASGGNNCPKLNGFVPFPGTNLWNLNIATAPVDPESATIASASGFAGEHLHHDFGSNVGYPIEVVDSSQTPASTVIQLQAHGNESDNVIAPIPLTVPIEGNPAPGTGCPATNVGDAHTHTLDRHTCTIYSTYNTHLCGTAPNQFLTADQLTAWDARNYEKRPYGWTSEDVSGSSMYAGIIKYDEVAACAAGGPVPPHAIRFTLPDTMNDSNNGFFVFPATHAAGTLWNSYNVIGMKIRLSSTFNLSGYSPINKCILEEMQQYGMILADNGSSFYFQGEPDPRWNDADLENLDSIQSSNFDVVTMDPGWPGYDSATAPTGASPIINSFTASVSSVSSGSSVTFTYDVSGDSYDFIDFAGVGTSGSGSVTARPTVTTMYTLNSTNQYGRTTSTPITITVPGSVIGTPVFTPAGGTYASAQTISITDSTPGATIYFTTDGSTPTTRSTVYSGPISVSVSQTINALATAPGYSNPSAVGSAVYGIGSSVVATPAFSPAAGTYSSTQTVTISTTTPSATIYYTTNGSTPTTSSTVYAGPITVSSTETLQAVAVASGYSTSAVGSATYTIGKPMLNTLLSVALVAHVSVNGPATSAAVNMTGANFIAVCESAVLYPALIPTDSLGNLYTLVYQSNNAAYLYTSPIGATVSSSMTFSAPGWPIAVMGFSGVASSTPDQTHAGTAGSPTTTGSITPTNANELILSCLSTTGQTGDAGMAATVSPLTLTDTLPLASPLAGAFVGAAYQVQTTSVPVAAIWTNTGDLSWNGQVAAIASFYSAESPAPLVITTTAVPEGFVSTAYASTSSLYSNQLAATGGVGPFAWTVTSGTLPTGLSLSSGGLLTGTPTGAVSARSITYKVTDSTSPTAQTATITLPITVAATMYSGGIGTCNGTLGPINGIQYTVFSGCSLGSTGGTAPYSFSYNTGSCCTGPPSGLLLNTSTGAWSGTIYDSGNFGVTVAESDSLGSLGSTDQVFFNIAGDYTESGWQFFPNDSIFHLNVASLPVDTSVAAPIPSAYQPSAIAIYGAPPYQESGISWAHWPHNQADTTVTTNWPTYWAPAVFSRFSWASPGPISRSDNPVQSAPISPYATIEGTQNQSTAFGYIGDGHSLSVTLPGGGNHAFLYEMYTAEYTGGQWYNSADGLWDLTSYAMPPPGLGTTDAAGLPVAPFLLTYDEALAGTINHATRFTLRHTLNYHVWPATSQAGQGTCTGGYEDSNHLILQPGSSGGGAPTGGCAGGAVGEIYRLKASFSTSGICVGNAIAQNIITGLRNYGIIDADNGASGGIIATNDARWPNLSCLNSITLGNFEPVNVQSVIKTLDGSNLPTVSYQTTVRGPTGGTPTAAPTFSPASGTYSSAQTVTISTTTPSATIYYTTNGSTPTTSSTVYAGPITVAATETLNAIAVTAGNSASPVGSAAYTITAPTLQSITVTPGSTSVAVGNSQQFKATGTFSDSSTSDLTTAVKWSSTNTATAAVNSAGLATAMAQGSANIVVTSGSIQAQAAVTILPAATVTFSPAAGSYTSAQSVTISTATPSATIYYTRNGSTPTTSSAVYAGSITVSSTETVQAIAVASGSTSTAGSATYTINLPAATVTFSPAGGTYTSAQSVTISTTTPSATIRYTTNGSTPTANSAVYSGPITVSSTETLQAIAVASGYSTSAVDLASYTISLPAAATPTFSPAGGSYSSAQSVTISTPTPSATIYYTTNGSTPTTSSAVYTGSIAVSSTETVQAIAVASGNSTSAAGSATYTISLPAAATPTVSPAGGTYTSAQTVNLSASHWSTIYYTTNGSLPTTSSAVYTGSITVSSTETINAIAVASGYSTSAVASASFTIGQLAASPSFSVAVSPASLAVAAGTSGTTTVLVTPQNGFAAETSLTCSGLPSWASCTFSPATVTPSGSVATSTLTITTTPLLEASRSGSNPLFPGAALAVSLCCFGWRRRRGLQVLMLAGAIMATGLCTGCGVTAKSPVQATVSIIAAHGDLAPNTNLTLTIM
jgi:hypothetical protein